MQARVEHCRGIGDGEVCSRRNMSGIFARVGARATTLPKAGSEESIGG